MRSRCRNSLLDGNIENYDWDAGYTCHQLSSGAIVVQLAQPYIIGSMRMLLWDCDDRNYSYYIETSVNDCRWDLAIDRTREACRYINSNRSYMYFFYTFLYIMYLFKILASSSIYPKTGGSNSDSRHTEFCKWGLFLFILYIY